MSEIKLRWYCGHYVGPAKWQNSEDFEPDECGTRFDTEDTRENWDACSCTATCPSCGAEMTQRHDDPEFADPPMRLGTLARALSGAFGLEWPAGERVKCWDRGKALRIERVTWIKSRVTIANVMFDVPHDAVTIDEQTPATP